MIDFYQDRRPENYATHRRGNHQKGKWPAKKTPIYIHSYFFRALPPPKNLAASKVADRLWHCAGAGVFLLVALGQGIIFAAGRPSGAAVCTFIGQF